MSDTKYGDMIENHEWKEPEPEETPERTSVKNHEIDVIYVTDPSEDMGYGREKYTATVSYDDETDDPFILYVVEHRWKGNYWRDKTDWEFSDVPEPVRRQVAAVLPVSGPDALDTDTRIIDEDGESRWEKYHKPALDAHEGGENLWAESSLKEAVERLDAAEENLTDDDAKETVRELVSEVQTLVHDVRGAPQDNPPGNKHRGQE